MCPLFYCRRCHVESVDLNTLRHVVQDLSRDITFCTFSFVIPIILIHAVRANNHSSLEAIQRQTLATKVII